MKCAAFAVVAGCLLFGTVPGAESPVRTEVERLIASSGADVAIAFRTLDGRDELLMRPDVEFHAASTMKVPVMIELFRQAQAGALRLDDTVPIVNEFHSIVDGSSYSLNPADDSDPAMYRQVGRSMSYRDLCEAMIAVSSNLAANLLIEHLGAANIQRTTDALGARGMHVVRGVEDTKAFERGLNNTTTARALLTLMEKIARGEAADGRSTDEMLAILERQKVNGRIPAGLPPGIPVAHKTGEIAKIRHDAAIVFAPRPFVLVVLVRGLEDGVKADALIAAITKVVYAGLEGQDGQDGRDGRDRREGPEGRGGQEGQEGIDATLADGAGPAER